MEFVLIYFLFSRYNTRTNVPKLIQCCFDFSLLSVIETVFWPFVAKGFSVESESHFRNEFYERKQLVNVIVNYVNVVQYIFIQREQIPEACDVFTLWRVTSHGLCTRPLSLFVWQRPAARGHECQVARRMEKRQNKYALTAMKLISQSTPMIEFSVFYFLN